MLDKEAVKSISVPKLLASMRSEGIPFLTDYYTSSRKRFNLVNIWVDLTKGQNWTINTDGDHPQEIGYGYHISFPDVRFSKRNHIKFKQDMESIKSDEKLESDWGEYLPSQVLKSEEVLLVTMLYREDGGRRWIVDPDKSWNMKTDKACKVRLNTLRKSYSDPLLGQQSTEEEEIIEEITEEEIVDDEVDLEVDPSDNIKRLLGIDPVEEEEILDDITPEPVDDPTQADAGLTSEQEDVISAEIIQDLVQGHMITKEAVDDAREIFQRKLDKSKKTRYGRYIGKDRNVSGMVNGLEQITSLQVERFNDMMTDAMGSHRGSEVEVEVARSQFNPLKARLDLKSAFFNEKGRKRRDRAVVMMTLHDELRETFKTMYKAGLMGQGLASRAVASNIDSFFLSFSQLIKDSKSKFVDLSSKLDEILKSMNDAQSETLVEGLDYSSVQAMKIYEYENSRGWDAEENIANRLEKMLDNLEEKTGPHPTIEKVREGRLAELRSRRYTWENHVLHLPAELYELARMPKSNSAVSSLEGVCVSSTVDDFSFEKTEKKTKSYDRYLSVTSPQYPGFEVRVWTSYRVEFRGFGRDDALHKSYTDKVSDATFKAHMKSLFFGISIVNQYDPSYTKIVVHYEKGVRAFYMDYGNYTVLSPTDSPTTALHEVMHSLEHREKKVGLFVRMFLLTRVDANNFAKVQRGEWGFKDAMHDDYASKVYEQNSSEVVTMGVQEFVSPDRALQLAKNDYPHYLLSNMIVSGKMKDYL